MSIFLLGVSSSVCYYCRGIKDNLVSKNKTDFCSCVPTNININLAFHSSVWPQKLVVTKQQLQQSAGGPDAPESHTRRWYVSEIAATLQSTEDAEGCGQAIKQMLVPLSFILLRCCIISTICTNITE